MRIALFSDVHANLPALDAVLSDIDRRAPDMVFCLGDLVGFNRWPNAVIGLLRQRRIPTVASPFDRGIGRSSDECGVVYGTPQEAAMGRISIDRTNQLIGAEERRYLRELPARIRLDLGTAQERSTILLQHGTSGVRRKAHPPETDEARTQRIAEQAGAAVLCHGSSHKPGHRTIPYEHNGELIDRYVIDTGSVGKPQDGDPRACYAILTLEEVRAHRPTVGVEFIRVPYDVERAARGVVEGELPWMYADMLREAF